MTPPVALLDFSVAPVGGARTYALNFLGALANAAETSSLPLVPHLLVADGPDGAVAEAVHACEAAGVNTSRCSTRPGRWRRRFERGRILHWAQAEVGADVVFVPRDIAPLRLRQPYVVLVRNLFAWERNPANEAVGGAPSAALMRALARRSVGRSSLTLCVSRAIEALLPAGTRSEVVHHGCSLEVDPEAAASRADDGITQVVNVGALQPHKRLDRVVDMVGVLARSGRATRLSVYGPVGDGAVRTMLANRGTAVLGYDPYCGELDPRGVAAALSRAHVVAFGDVFESFCMPMVEGLRCGAVVWVPDSPLTREICGDHAVAFDLGDETYAVDRLRQRLDDWARSSRDAQAWSRRYDWRTTVDRTCAALASAATST
jgi:glycosyltransferase involved in cell wall biosynthesis